MDPLPLDDLRPYVSEETYDMLLKADKEEEDLNNEEIPPQLFADDDEDDESPDRVQYWTSSTSQLDGYGGYEGSEEVPTEENGSIRVAYIVSDQSWQGFGHLVWSSARYLASVLAVPSRYQEILQVSSLEGLQVCELGAGTALPSLVAMKQGAIVTVSDQAVPHRIRCMAESVARNKVSTTTRVVPHDWGTDVAPVGEGKFDVVLAADCCYMPWLHSELLDSMWNLMHDQSVAIISYCLHGNTDNDDVRKIEERARSRGFVVEVLPSKQLTPQNAEMESTQGYVYSLRLRVTSKR